MHSAWLALGIVAMIACPLAAAGITHPQGMAVMRTNGSDTAVITWTPTAGSLTYSLYKGSSPSHLQLVTKTMSTYYVDFDSPPGTYYVVFSYSVFGETHTDSGQGQCVETSSDLTFSVNPDECTNPGGK